jgi:hypothetical protein
MVLHVSGHAVALHEDLLVASALPNDDKLTWFLGLMGAIYPQHPFTWAIIGNAQDLPRIRQGFDMLLAADIDILAWWTVVPLEPEAESAFNDLIRQAGTRHVATVFPGPARLGGGLPGVFSAYGALAAPPHLDICPVPQEWVEPPAVVTWGGWETTRAAWIGAGMPDALPCQLPPTSGHVFAVWSVVAMLAGISATSTERPAPDWLTARLRMLCVPVIVRPSALTPRLGFFEPRQIEIFSDYARRA